MYSEVSIDVWLEGAPGTRVDVSASEARNGLGLISRLEHRVHRLEEHRARVLDQAAQCDEECTRAAEGLDAPFPKSVELAAATAEMARITAALDALARKQDNRAGDRAA